MRALSCGGKAVDDAVPEVTSVRAWVRVGRAEKSLMRGGGLRSSSSVKLARTFKPVTSREYASATLTVDHLPSPLPSMIGTRCWRKSVAVSMARASRMGVDSVKPHGSRWTGQASRRVRQTEASWIVSPIRLALKQPLWALPSVAEREEMFTSKRSSRRSAQRSWRRPAGTAGTQRPSGVTASKIVLGRVGAETRPGRV